MSTNDDLCYDEHEITIGTYDPMTNVDDSHNILMKQQKFIVQILIQHTDLYYIMTYDGPNFRGRFYHYYIRIYAGNKTVDLPLRKVEYRAKLNPLNEIPTNLKKYKDVRLCVMVRDGIFQTDSRMKVLYCLQNDEDDN